MKLGILVNTDRHPEHVLGIAEAAVNKNHDVTVFVMDDGILLLGFPVFEELTKLADVSVSICRHSAELREIATDHLPAGIHAGSQLENALMNHDADRVIVL